MHFHKQKSIQDDALVFRFLKEICPITTLQHVLYPAGVHVEHALWRAVRSIWTNFPHGSLWSVCGRCGRYKVAVQHWACFKDSHQDRGPHYHMTIKLSGPKRWLSVKNSVEKSHGTVLHFSDKHDNCRSVYRYICKTDKNFAHNIGHPNLT